MDEQPPFPICPWCKRMMVEMEHDTDRPLGKRYFYCKCGYDEVEDEQDRKDIN
jgi:hypothetical protein